MSYRIYLKIPKKGIQLKDVVDAINSLEYGSEDDWDKLNNKINEKFNESIEICDMSLNWCTPEEINKDNEYPYNIIRRKDILEIIKGYRKYFSKWEPEKHKDDDKEQEYYRRMGIYFVLHKETISSFFQETGRGRQIARRYKLFSNAIFFSSSSV